MLFSLTIKWIIYPSPGYLSLVLTIFSKRPRLKLNLKFQSKLTQSLAEQRPDNISKLSRAPNISIGGKFAFSNPPWSFNSSRRAPFTYKTVTSDATNRTPGSTQQAVSVAPWPGWNLKVRGLNSKTALVKKFGKAKRHREDRRSSEPHWERLVKLLS